MRRVRIGLVVTVLGGAAWASGARSGASASQTCAGLAAINAPIQSEAHQAGNELRRQVHGELNSLGGDVSGTANGPAHQLANPKLCAGLP